FGQPRATSPTPGTQGGMMLDTLFGEGQSGLKILFFVIVVLVLLALAFWLLRRFGAGRLGGGAARGRQPRLAVIDQATVDGRRRLVLIRRDNVEHLLIIGGPTDVVVEQNIVRAAAALREAGPARPPAAADTLPRAVPLGEDTGWPPEPEPAPKVEPAARVEPSLRAEARPQRSSTAAEEPMPWPGRGGGGWSVKRGRCLLCRRPPRRRASASHASRIHCRAWRKNCRGSPALPSPPNRRLAACRGCNRRRRRPRALPTPRSSRPPTRTSPKWRNGWRRRCDVPVRARARAPRPRSRQRASPRPSPRHSRRLRPSPGPP